MGVYESNNLKFNDLCKQYNFEPVHQIDELDNYGRKIDIKTILFEESSFNDLNCSKSVAESQFLKKLESKPTEKQQKVVKMKFEEF
jgi:hypothetical protein